MGLDLSQLALQIIVGPEKLIRRLQVDPELRRCIEKTSKADRHLSANPALFENDIVNRLRINVQSLRQPVARCIFNGSRNSFFKISPGCTLQPEPMRPSRPIPALRLVVVVRDFHVIRISILPREAHAVSTTCTFVRVGAIPSLR